MLGVDLHSQDPLLKYIGGFHNYLRHTILMVNPTNLDEVCVQATHLEARGKHSANEKSDSFLEYEGKRKGKLNGRGKKNGSIKIKKEKLTCKHYQKNGHDEDHCWQLHLELKRNKLKTKENEKIDAIMEHDLASHSRNETKITIMG